MDGGRKLLSKSRATADSNFDLYSNANAPQAYADGVAAFMLGPMVCRVSLFSVELPDADEPDTEKRVISQNVVLPTRALLEFCVNVLSESSKMADKFSPAFQTELKKITDSLDKVKK